MTSFLKKYYPFIPIIGMGAYLIVFTVAAVDYPGGSENIHNLTSYSFFHNFLCDVMNPVTQSGVLNPARSLATISHLILSATMITFFYVLPEIFHWSNRNTKLIRYIGMLTMTVFVFMYTSIHDHIVTATGVLGTFALIPFFIELKKYPKGGLKILAYVCFILSIIVFFIFESKIGYYYLPILQKITFIFDAWWVIWVSMIVWKKKSQEDSLQASGI
ncbi:MAG: hypothetical protein JXR10_05145 [Cyclobacteriaceae bacterium]